MPDRAASASRALLKLSSVMVSVSVEISSTQTATQLCAAASPDPDEVTAIQMAKEAGIRPKAFRHALDREKLSWHTHSAPWIVRRNSQQHDDMRRVLNRLISKRDTTGAPSR